MDDFLSIEGFLENIENTDDDKEDKKHEFIQHEEIVKFRIEDAVWFQAEHLRTIPTPPPTFPTTRKVTNKEKGRHASYMIKLNAFRNATVNRIEHNFLFGHYLEAAQEARMLVEAPASKYTLKTEMKFQLLDLSARSLVHLGNFSEATPLLEELVSARMVEVDSWNLLARCYAATDQRARSVDAYMRALDSVPFAVHSWLAFGQLLLSDPSPTATSTATLSTSPNVTSSSIRSSELYLSFLCHTRVLELVDVAEAKGNLAEDCFYLSAPAYRRAREEARVALESTTLSPYRVDGYPIPQQDPRDNHGRREQLPEDAEWVTKFVRAHADFVRGFLLVAVTDMSKEGHRGHAWKTTRKIEDEDKFDATQL